MDYIIDKDSLHAQALVHLTVIGLMNRITFKKFQVLDCKHGELKARVSELKKQKNKI